MDAATLPADFVTGATVCEGGLGSYCCTTPAFANDGELLIVPDPANHRIVAFHTADRTVAWTIGGEEGKEDGQLNGPRAVFVLPGGTAGLLVVVDNGNHRLQWFDLATRAHIRTVGKRGDGALEFDGPQGGCVMGSGDIAVADTGNHRIQTLDPEIGRAHV